MPRKRRKAINTETDQNIPYPKVRVEWVDCVSDSAWASEKEFNKIVSKMIVPPNKPNFETNKFASEAKDFDEWYREYKNFYFTSS